MVVKVCDMIMGAGKTSAAINHMNHDMESRFLFITPFLDEADRIQQSCPDLHFIQPQRHGKDGKLEDLHNLMKRKCNIVSTHALFKTYNETTKRLIRDGGYKLILDEVTDVFSEIKMSAYDREMLLASGTVHVDQDTGRIYWDNDAYAGQFDGFREMSMTGNLFLYHGHMIVWKYPADIFTAFSDVIVLTYLFDAQKLKYFFDMNGIEIKKIGTVCENGEHHFCDASYTPDYVRDLPNKIHILEDKKLNAIGDAPNALSVSWYKRAKEAKGQPAIRRLKNNITNVFINRYRSHSEDNLWTTFSEYKWSLKGKGYTNGFLAFNSRATNKYSERTKLAYCVNCYFNPFEKSYFLDHGVEVKEDEYALSEMIQWIWRSAIRDGKEIWIYIPSRRMRDILRGWLDSLVKEDA